VTDNGLDQELPPDRDWLVFASKHCPLRVWPGIGDAAFSQQNVARALGEYGSAMVAPHL